ncbi:MAG: dihydrodipicolinate synthase family protein, partial [Mariprofundaceae bacterium]|nr:dihydrodipicolinate synthase family protein [Mariprofundaceae bacterium]
MFDPQSLHGIVPPMCTPLTEEGDVDVASVHSLVDYLIDGGVHGIFALGSSSEGPLLTSRQKKVLLEATVAASRGRVPVMAGIMDTSTARCIENGQMAREVSLDAVVLTS